MTENLYTTTLGALRAAFQPILDILKLNRIAAARVVLGATPDGALCVAGTDTRRVHCAPVPVAFCALHIAEPCTAAVVTDDIREWLSHYAALEAERPVSLTVCDDSTERGRLILRIAKAGKRRTDNVDVYTTRHNDPYAARFFCWRDALDPTGKPLGGGTVLVLRRQALIDQLRRWHTETSEPDCIELCVTSGFRLTATLGYEKRAVHPAFAHMPLGHVVERGIGDYSYCNAKVCISLSYLDDALALVDSETIEMHFHDTVVRLLPPTNPRNHFAAVAGRVPLEV